MPLFLTRCFAVVATAVVLLTVTSNPAQALQLNLSNVDLPDRSSRITTDLESELIERRQAYVEDMEELRQEAIEDLQREESRERDQLISLRIKMEIERLENLNVTQLQITADDKQIPTDSVDLFATPEQAVAGQGAPTQPGAWRQVTVDAADRKGTSIGPIAAGQTLYVRYLSGQWNGVNPDVEARFNKHKCGVFKKNAKKMGSIPLHSRQNPFMFTFKYSHDNLKLRNEANFDRDERREGLVIYEVKIE